MLLTLASSLSSEHRKQFPSYSRSCFRSWRERFQAESCKRLRACRDQGFIRVTLIPNGPYLSAIHA